MYFPPLIKQSKVWHITFYKIANMFFFEVKQPTKFNIRQQMVNLMLAMDSNTDLVFAVQHFEVTNWNMQLV